MKYLSTPAQRLGEALGACGLYHELLYVDVIVGVLTPVDDIHHRHRQRILPLGAIKSGDVRVKRQLYGGGRSFRGG